MIDTFATGDIDTAKELLAGDYIQHNFAYGTGRIKVQVNLLHLPTSVNFHQNITVIKGVNQNIVFFDLTISIARNASCHIVFVYFLEACQVTWHL